MKQKYRALKKSLVLSLLTKNYEPLQKSLISHRVALDCIMRDGPKKGMRYKQDVRMSPREYMYDVGMKRRFVQLNFPAILSSLAGLLVRGEINDFDICPLSASLSQHPCRPRNHHTYPEDCPVLIY